MPRIRLAVLLGALLLPAALRSADPPFYFRILDTDTKRGVPLVFLETVHAVRFVSDSAGIVAVDEPALRDREVWFSIHSDGYEYPADGFGNRGLRVRVVRGQSKVIELQRTQLAERLYRVTGAGIYRDSVMVGLPVPIQEPLMNGGVLGQDGALTAIYRGRLYWFWGDTSRASYPLGNFASSGATSKLPGSGAVDPGRGIDLHYFVGEDGFSRAMCPLPGPGVVWLDGLTVLRENEQERMLCRYSRMQDLGTRLEHGYAEWSDEREVFEKLHTLPESEERHASGHPLRASLDGEEWILFANPFPVLRVRARCEDYVSPDAYEAFSCLLPGRAWSDSEPPLERDAEGALVWAWKRNCAPVSPERWAKLLERRHVRADDGPLRLRDIETGARLRVHSGSLSLNEYRGKWVMIFLQAFGRSMLGEVWYAEADAPTGPWTEARRVVTHSDYSFYNPRQHPYFAQEGGRFIYFEGTYSHTFSGSPIRTPRYDYNQILYRLDLADPRLRAKHGK